LATVSLPALALTHRWGEIFRKTNKQTRPHSRAHGTPTAAPTEAEIRGFAKDADASGTGLISWQDFLKLAAMLTAHPIDKAERAKNAFKVFDSDKDGLVSARELRHCLTTLGDKLPKEDIDEAYREAGITDDTNLDLNAFLRLMGVGNV
jgi:Ca2+-binding EF-hand superfamily protein